VLKTKPDIFPGAVPVRRGRTRRTNREGKRRIDRGTDYLKSAGAGEARGWLKGLSCATEIKREKAAVALQWKGWSSGSQAGEVTMEKSPANGKRWIKGHGKSVVERSDRQAR